LHATASLVLRPVALDGLVAEAVRPHQLAMQAGGQRLVLDLEPASVDLDADKIRSIIDNLLGNAVKFTPAGGTVRIVQRVDGKNITLDVIDSGPGVPLEEREAIFNSFFRGRARPGGRVAGTGLGLAIAREFAEAHGGRVALVPSNEGAHFRVTLPRKRTRELAVAA
jgi:two-component system sensor histidine kinase GlrK